MRGADIRQQVEIDFLDAVNGAQPELLLPDGRRLKVTIPPGTTDGQTLRLKGQGGASPTGGPSGDLHLEIKVRPHPQFTRKDNDILAELPVTLGEALLGARSRCRPIDGVGQHDRAQGRQHRHAAAGARQGRAGRRAASRGDHYVTLEGGAAGAAGRRPDQPGRAVER